MEMHQNPHQGQNHGLNQQQMEAVNCLNGPLLILAGAGAGKTKTITHRILHLIETGVDPSSILAITFTNKAANEMKERVMKLLDHDKNLNLPVQMSALGSRPFVSTFHSLCVYILREFGHEIGIPKHFVIFDKGDSKQAMKDAIKQCDLDPKQTDPGKIASIISREKGKNVSQEEYLANNGGEYFGETVAKIWEVYQKNIRKEKALDFDDLLVETVSLLRSKESVRRHYQKKWKYIHIDEYQDTNVVQYDLAKLLIGEEQNIAVVGDVDQAIYSWRGANIQNIMRFEEDFRGAKIILLEENYRSTQTILTAANDVIVKNIFRKDKRLFTNNSAGEKIALYTGYDENDEANYVSNNARELIQNGTKAEEIAVLYRANFQSRILEESFLRKNIPYQVLGVRFFERKEIKDVLSYLRLSLNRDSLSDLKRILNVPARGLGKTTLLKIVEDKTAGLPANTLGKINQFYELLDSIKYQISKTRASEVVKFVLEKTGIEKELKQETDGDERLENAREMVSIATKYDDMPGEEGILKLIEEATLANDQDSMDINKRLQYRNDFSADQKPERPEKTGVKLMTVHASKGLEFEHVFICGMEQDLFPHSKSFEAGISPEESEEERRLFYVAITRAKSRVYLSYANIRTIFGSRQINVPSEFLNDIDASLLEREEQEEVGGIKSIFIDF